MKAISAGLMICLSSLSGCITLHNTSIGDISKGGKKFFVEITDIGINVERTSKLISEMTKKEQDADNVKNIIGLFQWGPRTGNPVYNISAWSKLGEKILEQCPSGQVHSLVSNREFRDFYYGSAEGVRVSGYCMGETK